MFSQKVNQKTWPHPSYLLTASCFGWLLGISIASFFGKLDWLLVIVWGGGCFIGWLIFRRRIFLLMALMLIFVSLGLMRYQNYLSLAPLGLAQYNGTKQEFVGIVIEEPDVRINHVKLTVEVNSLVKNKEKISEQGLVLLSVGLYPIYHYGDELLVSCTLRAPEPFAGFAYDKFLAKEGIYSTCSFATVKLISRGGGDWLKTVLIDIKQPIQQKINQNLPEPHASVASAMILGARKTIPPNLVEALSKTGTSHMVAISGMHIAIIAGLIGYALIFVGVRRQYLVLVVSPILFLYVVLIGFPPSAVRATIMGFILLVAISLGRLSGGTNILLLAAVFMTAYNPLLMRDDIGFQLSFSAVLGIMQLSGFFVKIGKFVIPSDFINKIFSATAAATLATAPFTLWHFGRLSLIGILVNILIIPALPLIIIFSLSAIFLSMIFPAVSNMIFWPAYFLLNYIIEIVFWFSEIPYAYIDLL